MRSKNVLALVGIFVVAIVFSLGLWATAELSAQDANTVAPFGRNIGNVYNRPAFSSGATIYSDATLRFRDSNAYLYSNASGYITTSGTILFSQADSSAFTGTETVDTLLVSGVSRTSMILLTAKGSSVDQQDVLQYICTDDTVFVHRLASGASGLVYVYMWVK
jgi:hypothetical protein